MDEFFRRLDAEKAFKKLRLTNPWVLYLIKVLWSRPHGVRRVDVMDQIRGLRAAKGLPTPRRFEEAVQSRFNHYAEESSVFQKRGAPPEEALFYSPKGKGTGIWACYPERAAAWLRKKGLGEL
jgi:hypothetical protein